MSCKCEVSTCIKVYVSPCDTGIDLGLVAPATGDYTFILEFNGTYQHFVLSLLSGNRIVIPNCVNGDYLHELQIYHGSPVTLLNDTCYSLSVVSIIGDGNGLTPAPPPSTWKIIIAQANGDTLTDPFFSTHTINEITTEGQSYLAGVNFTQTGDTITGIDISFSYGQILKAEA